MNAYECDEEVQRIVLTATDKPCGITVVPDEYPDGPYSVVVGLTSPGPAGTLGKPLANQTLKYAIHMVADNPRTVRWMQDKVKAAMLAQPPAHADWQWASMADGYASVADRDSIYSAVDVYEVRI